MITEITKQLINWTNDLEELVASEIKSNNANPNQAGFTSIADAFAISVYNCLGFHVYTKLTKMDAEQDLFERKMEFYRKEYERELDLVLRDGVEYDHDSSGNVTDTEKAPPSFLRLKR